MQHNFEYRMLYGALVVTLWTCYGALQIVILLLFIITVSFEYELVQLNGHITITF